ncbi:MAG: TIGR04086 family membrane protein [Clostridiales bacterium]|jgi:putative membrane protein (TIGR04086 family)|nr:TIGR04086 family membrane protein [Clostridiales bacterium]
MLVITITCIISVVIAGYDAARGAKNKGWLWGILAGLLYAVILVAIGFFIDEDFTFDTSSITLLILAVAGGGLGGVIGINIKK